MAVGDGSVGGVDGSSGLNGDEDVDDVIVSTARGEDFGGTIVGGDATGLDGLKAVLDGDVASGLRRGDSSLSSGFVGAG